VQEGNKALLISLGQVGDDTLQLAERRNADVYTLCRVKPLPEDELKALLSKYGEVTVVEDHQGTGGLRAAIAECTSNIRGVNLSDSFAAYVGRETELRERTMFNKE